MREWLVTNGIGGYASLTYQNTNTRKFHGLLISSLNPPRNRWVFVSNIYDKIKINDKLFDLTGVKNNFSFNYFPCFTYQLGDVKVKKTVFMQFGKNTTILRYDVKTKKPVTMYQSPVITSRHFYDVNHLRESFFQQSFNDNVLNIKYTNVDKNLKIIIDDVFYQPDTYWEVLFFKKDLERKEAWVDNNVITGSFKKEIKKDVTFYVVLTVENELENRPSEIYAMEKNRRMNLVKNSGLPNKFKKLVLSADNFIVRKNDSKSIIAGYHWFSDWGRDALISLPGLTLVTGRYFDAKQILLNFAEHCKNGLIPNVFTERESEAVYNTVDASLWFIDRVYQYLKYTDDQVFLRKIWPTLVSILDYYKKGTEFNIYMDEDFLINHGPGLTWMDVKIGDHYVTPRSNKAVEIQALWYNALRIMSIFSRLLEENDRYYELSLRVKESFNCLYDKQFDVIDKKDLSLRPNKIFLVSLDFNMVGRKTQVEIVEEVEDKLLTVFGLRTLAPNEKGYNGYYIGGFNKDLVYHNGVVWPWLMGPFLRSFVKVKDHRKKWREYAFKKFLKPMLNIFGDKWDGSIPEIFDGNPVYAPHGCISQAWSVAEILRAWVEDIEDIKPRYEKNYVLKRLKII